MKNTFFIILIIIASVFIGCEEQVGFDPEFVCEINPNPAVAGEEVVFIIEGEADRFAIYTGDDLHKYADSYAVLTEGQEIDKEDTYLTQDSLNVIIATGDYPTSVTDKLSTIIDEVYISKVQARTSMNMLLEDTLSYTNVDLNQWTGEIIEYFETDWGLLEPEEGWSTGFNINVGTKEYKYTYSTAGTYTVTVIGVTVGEKLYEGSGYQDEREYTAREYPIKRIVKEYTVTVN